MAVDRFAQTPPCGIVRFPARLGVVFGSERYPRHLMFYLVGLIPSFGKKHGSQVMAVSYVGMGGWVTHTSPMVRLTPNMALNLAPSVLTPRDIKPR